MLKLTLFTSFVLLSSLNAGALSWPGDPSPFASGFLSNHRNRVGLFFVSGNPITRGHERVIESSVHALSSGSLDFVFVVPTYHIRSLPSFHYSLPINLLQARHFSLRMQMIQTGLSHIDPVRAALEMEAVYTDLLEASQRGCQSDSTTCYREVIETLREYMPKDYKKIHLIVGTTDLAEHGDAIREALSKRDYVLINNMEGAPHDFEHPNMTYLSSPSDFHVRAQEIRERIAAGEDVPESMIHPDVLQLVLEQQEILDYQRVAVACEGLLHPSAKSHLDGQ